MYITPGHSSRGAGLLKLLNPFFVHVFLDATRRV
uniref:Uncharacterized protein n=1 Tax=Arundo donax TaxID=35708 RepID=A0A0A9EY74_ARUDO